MTKTYRQVQAELKQRGINARGSRAKLRSRLKASKALDSPTAQDEPVSDKTYKIMMDGRREVDSSALPIEPSTEVLDVAMVDCTKETEQVTPAPRIEEDISDLAERKENGYESSTRKQRALDLVAECNIIMAGKAEAVYDDNNPKCIEFHGGPRKRQDVALAQPDKSIYHFAKSYVARTAHDLGSVDGRSGNVDQALFDALKGMSNEQKHNLIKSL